MNDQIDLSIKALCEESTRNAKEKGFSNQSFPEFLALVHSELSEALEEFRNNKAINETWYSVESESNGVKYRRPCDANEDGAKPEGIPSELSDVLIRVFHYCGENNLDLVAALREKVLYNRTRSYKHGNKRI